MIASGSCPWKCKGSTGSGRLLLGRTLAAEASGSFDEFGVISDQKGTVIKMQIKI